MRIRMVPIGELVLKCDTWNPKKEGTGEFSYIDLSSVHKDEKQIVEVQDHACSEAPSRARQLVQAGDVLVATVRPNLNGVAFVSDLHCGMTASTGFCVLRPDSSKLDSAYLFHWVKTRRFINKMIDMATGASYPAVSDAKVKVSQIPLPPLPEQKRIAKILDQADALRVKRREAIAKLDTFLQSTFLDMFGDPVTNPKGWEVKKLPEGSTKFCDGPFGSNLKSSDYEKTGVRVIRLQNIGIGQLLENDLAYISNSHFQSLPKNHCKPGDIVIGTLGEPNLRACIIPEYLTESLNKADCLLYRVNNQLVDKHYICHLLNSPGLVKKAQEYVRGQTRGRISLGRLKQLTIPLPPLQLQQQFADIVTKVESQKQQMRDHLSQLDTLFDSLQSRAFNGDL